MQMMLNGSENIPPYGMNPNNMNPNNMSPLGPMAPMNPNMNSMPNQMGNNMPNMDWNHMNQMNQMQQQQHPNQMNPNYNPNYFAGGMNTVARDFSQMNMGGGSMNPAGFNNNFSQVPFPFDMNVFDNPLIYNNFKLFDSATFNGRDLLFLDQTVTFMDLDDKTSYLTFLSKFNHYYYYY